MSILLALVVAYLIGTIPFGYLVARLSGIEDIRKHGSGNIGATNVWRTLGFRAAIWVFVGDVGKGMVALLVARLIAGGSLPDSAAQVWLMLGAGVAAVIGHMFPFFLGFKGGKGVNTSLGVMLVLLPFFSMLALGVFMITLLLTKYVSLSSITGVIALFVSLLCARFAFSIPVPDPYLIAGAVIMTLVIVAHRSNIKRLLDGTERKIVLSPPTTGKRR